MNDLLSRLMPPWAAGYDRRAPLSDLLAGLILAVLLVPQAMAYALLAGLPPEVGLYTAIIPPILYAALGQSAFVSVGPVALVSLLVADAVAASGMPPTVAASVIAVEAGALLVGLGLLRLGRLVNFVSEPALLGFTAAAAILIAVSQVPSLIGVHSARSGNLVDALNGLWWAGPPDIPTLALGAGALVLLLIGNKFAAPALWKIGVRPPWRMAIAKSVPLVVIVLAALIAAPLGEGIARIERPSGGLPDLGVGSLDPALWMSLLAPSSVIALVAFVTGTAVAKSLSGRARKALDTSREAMALGAANMVAGVTGSYAAGVSLSRSALVYDSGARSPLATVVAGGVVLLVILFGADLLSMLPETALAALVISAVFGLMKYRDILDVWRHDRWEGGVVVVTFVATLGLGVTLGLMIGAGAGVAAFLWHSSLPRITRLGRSRGEGYAFRSIDRDEIEIDTLPVLVVRIDRSLYFGNVGHCEDRLLSLLAVHPEAKALLLDMRAVNAVDASGIRMLNRLLETLREEKVEVGFAVLHQPVKAALESSGKARMTPFFLTVEQGVAALEQKCGGEAQVIREVAEEE